MWVLAWAVLGGRWKDRHVRSPATVMAITLALLLLAAVAVFPPFFGLLTKS